MPVTPEVRADRGMVRFFKILPAVFGGLSAIIGALAITAWIAHQEGLTKLIPASLPMSPLTGVACIVFGLALMLAQRESRFFSWSSKLIAVAVVLTGMVVLGEYVTGMQSGLDTLVFAPVKADVAGHDARRMAVNTAIAFVFLAVGLLFLADDRRTNGLKSQFFATLALIVAFIALVGHMFGVRISTASSFCRAWHC